MNNVKLLIWNHKTYCRITCNDVRTQYRSLENGAVILDMETLFFCIKQISEGCKALDSVAVFEVIDAE